MRVNFFSQSGTSNGSSSPGLSATMTGPLVLAGNPTGPLEATPKQYVDGIVNSLNAANIKTGVVNAARLPAFTGDVSSATGSGTFLLSNTGVVAGTYTKITTDSKGRVLTGSNITIDDIPPFNWSKIGTGTPTTIAGYGITDALAKTDTTVTGTLSLNVDPTLPLHAATKQYVDLSGGGGSLLAPGIVTRRITNTTPTGFLRCNGSLVVKANYSALYAVIGDLYTGGNTQPGNGQPWRHQYQINLSQSDTINSWTTGASLPIGLFYSQAIVTKNRVYLLGGAGNGGYSNAVYTAPINSDGTLGTWTTGTSLPFPIACSQAIVTKNRVYLLGGHGYYDTANPEVDYSRMTLTAPINTDGTLGTWTTGPMLFEGMLYKQAIVTKNRVYLLGDGNGNKIAIYFAPINTDGTLGSWTKDSTTLNMQQYGVQAIVTKNRVYLLGVGSSYNIIYTAPINTDGVLGAWTPAGTLPVGAVEAQAITTKNRVYLLGISGNPAVYSAPINADGTLGVWVSSISLPSNLYRSQAIVTKNRIYVLGGYTNTSPSASSVVYTASILDGLNDYTTYYNGSITPLDPNTFALPDFSSLESIGEFYFIKT